MLHRAPLLLAYGVAGLGAAVGALTGITAVLTIAAIVLAVTGALSLSVR